MNVRKKFSLKNRLYLLLLICVIPLTVMITYLLFMINNVSSKYDHIVEKITKANAYNIGFKEDIDYVMYIIVVNSERAEELVDTQKPQKMIKEAREVFGELAEDADSAYAKQRLSRILKSLDTLEKRVQEIEEDALVSGSYETNMESLDLNIRVLTELIQEQIQYYIYYESMNMEDLRGGIRNDVEQAIAITSGILLVILVGAFAVSRKIVTGITEPIGELCDAAVAAGGGDFRIRAVKTGPEEIEVLNKSFNQMVEKIGNLVEDIHTEELNLRAAELRVPTASGDPKLCGGIWGFGVFDNGDEAKVKAAKTFIEFIAADPDQVKDSVLASTYFPVRASVGDIYADNAIMSEYTKFMAYLGDYYQITPGWATARTEWWNMLQRVGTGEDVATSVATFVQNANAAAAAEA